MTDKQRLIIEGMDRLLSKFSKYPDSTEITVGDLIRASNEVYRGILTEEAEVDI